MRLNLFKRKFIWFCVSIGIRVILKPNADKQNQIGNNEGDTFAIKFNARQFINLTVHIWRTCIQVNKRISIYLDLFSITCASFLNPLLATNYQEKQKKFFSDTLLQFVHKMKKLISVESFAHHKKATKNKISQTVYAHYGYTMDSNKNISRI